MCALILASCVAPTCVDVLSSAAFLATPPLVRTPARVTGTQLPVPGARGATPAPIRLGGRAALLVWWDAISALGGAVVLVSEAFEPSSSPGFMRPPKGFSRNLRLFLFRLLAIVRTLPYIGPAPGTPPASWRRPGITGRERRRAATHAEPPGSRAETGESAATCCGPPRSPPEASSTSTNLQVCETAYAGWSESTKPLGKYGTNPLMTPVARRFKRFTACPIPPIEHFPWIETTCAGQPHEDGTRERCGGAPPSSHHEVSATTKGFTMNDLYSALRERRRSRPHRAHRAADRSLPERSEVRRLDGRRAFRPGPTLLVDQRISAAIQRRLTA